MDERRVGDVPAGDRTEEAAGDRSDAGDVAALPGRSGSEGTGSGLHARAAGGDGRLLRSGDGTARPDEAATHWNGAEIVAHGGEGAEEGGVAPLFFPALFCSYRMICLGRTAMSATVVITGAFSYTGKYATRLLLDRGYEVRTLTYHPDRSNSFGDRVQIFPYNFDRPGDLRRSLRGASTLINTYWARFPRAESNFETAVRNTRTLIEAAKDAGVQRIVHVSIANPSLESPLGYYRGKAQVEQAVVGSGLSYAILRPTVIFGAEDILINNIAWF